MTDVKTTSPDAGERFVFALRQAATLAVALFVAGLVTDRLRPIEALDRGIASTAFLWAIVVWTIVLLVNAVLFDESQIGHLEGWPLYGGLIAGALLLVAGLISFDAGTMGRRAVYLVANSMGGIMFWWGVFSLALLTIRHITK